ncbi:MAG TPA: PAS-domain containing protein [Candidatus Alectryocaccomicrobium excrementavium]|uniref:histidine kinase n=1 Tax=Candidatus Alectryocaccomicrobium excrementavium TaxID=2840668 RepID=A0A9D1FZL5_9FIRM|nr:PAS-domain containing protein [Candidatus Alectryocaccomicrobium excrementavium]
MKRAIFWRMMAVALAAVLLSGGILLWAFYDAVTDELDDSVEREARIAAQGMEQAADPQAFLDGFAPGTRVTWIAADGSVLYDSEADSAEMENHASRPEVQSALRLGAGGGSRLSDTMRERTHYFAVRLADGTVLRLSETHETALGRVYGILWVFVLLFAGMIALCAMLARQASRALVEPINGLNLDDPENNDVYDELAPLLIRLSRQGAHIREQMAQLETRQTEFTAVVDNMAEGLVLLNANLRVLAVNRSALALFGAPANCLGEHLLKLTRDHAIVQIVDRAAAGTRCEQIVEIGGRQYQAMANPVKGGGVVLLLPDVSERYAAERMRREFSANVSHELKTPLTAVAGYAELLASGLAKPEDARGFGQKILDESGRLLALIDDIMRLSRLDEGAPGAHMQPENLGEIAQGVAERLRPLAQKHGVSLAVDSDASIVTGVRALLEEMVHNLVDNAIKYNVENGSVRVAVKDGALTVEDTGIGVAQQDQQKIFERFYRVDKSRSREAGGTGLGLSIVKHIAQLHGAQVSLESEPGKGTKITVRFPK